MSIYNVIASNMAENDALAQLHASIVSGSVSASAKLAGRKQMKFIPLRDASGKRDTSVETYLTIEVMPGNDGQFLTVGNDGTPTRISVKEVTDQTVLMYKVQFVAYIDTTTNVVVQRKAVTKVNIPAFYVVPSAEDGLSFVKFNAETAMWENWKMTDKLSRWGLRPETLASILTTKLTAFMNDWKANPATKFVDLRKAVKHEGDITSASNPLAFSTLSDSVRAKLLAAK